MTLKGTAALKANESEMQALIKGINPILNNNFFVSQKFINNFLDV